MPRAGSGAGQPGGGRPQPRAAEWPSPDPRQRDYYGSEQDYQSSSGYQSSGYQSSSGYPSSSGYRSQADYQPQSGYAEADYAQFDYQAQSDGLAPWEGGLPEPDPALRYREPGPGMPGYRGSRDARYGGDRR
jgi:hypothetical protein